MLQTYNDLEQSLAAGSNVVFGSNTIQRGFTVTHIAGDTDIKLNVPGIYKIEFDAVVTGTDPVILTLYNNGNEVPGAMAETTPQSATDLRSVSFTTLLRIPRSCCIVNNDGNLNIRTTNEVQINHANLVVTRISN